MPPDRIDRELARFDPDVPIERASTIPASWYLEPEILELEKQAVFAASAQYAGPTDRLVRAGDCVTLSIAGEPAAVIRGDDGDLRAVANVCRHRAAVLLTGDFDHVQTVRCPYHGWTYALDGSLRGAPEFEDVEDFERTRVCLPRYRVQVGDRFVFVDRSGTSRELPTDLFEHIRSQTSGPLELRRRVAYEVACNWKVYVDNYLDGGYHVGPVHPALHSVIRYRDYRCELHDGWNVQISPLRPAEGDAGVVRTGETAHYYWVWPNWMVNCYSGIMDTNFVVPVGADRTRVVFDYWFAPGTPEDFVNRSIAVAERVQEEDRAVCESVQRGLRGGSFDTGRYSVRRENGDRQFHAMLGRTLQRVRRIDRPVPDGERRT